MLIDLRKLIDALGQLDANRARHAIAALEWDTCKTRTRSAFVLVRLPAARRAYPGTFLHELADATRCYPFVTFEGDPATVREWEAGYHRITAGVALLDLGTFVDTATGRLDHDEAAAWLGTSLLRDRLTKARSAAVGLPEYRTIEPVPTVASALGRAVDLANADRSRAGREPLSVRFHGLSAAAWQAAYRATPKVDKAR